MAGSVLGEQVLRKEDPKFLTTGGVYVEDFTDPRLDGAVHVVFARSPVAHGRINSIDTSEAERMPGVIAVHAAESLADGLNPYAYHPGTQPPPSVPYGINLNPPASLIPFTVLNEVADPATGRLAIQVLSALGLLVMLAALVRRYPANGGALTLIALVWVSHIGGTIWWGQI